MKNAIILGSSRNDGNTKELVSELLRLSDWDLIDLSEYNISYFDYNQSNQNDDFINLMKIITERYEVLIFATPVYWYSMSGIMKVFFDRITDLLRHEKEIGRKLRHKHMAVVSSSNGDNLGEEFWLPFKKSAEYLGMNYITNLHTVAENIDSKEIMKFIEVVENADSNHSRKT